MKQVASTLYVTLFMGDNLVHFPTSEINNDDIFQSVSREDVFLPILNVNQLSSCSFCCFFFVFLRGEKVSKQNIILR